MKKAIIDIDGVLNTYPKTQIEYFNMMLDKKYTTLDEIKRNLSYYEYKYLKTRYRQSDFKHNAKPSNGAKKLLKYLKTHDYLIYIITARELFKYNQLEKIKNINGKDCTYINVVNNDNINRKYEGIRVKDLNEIINILE